MLRLRNQLANHGLNNTDVAVEEAANGPADQSNPNVGGKTDHDHAEHGADASQEQYGFASDAVRKTTPVHAHQGLGEGEGGDEETGVEGGIFGVANFKPLDECPSIGKDGCEGDGLGKADDGCGM